MILFREVEWHFERLSTFLSFDAQYRLSRDFCECFGVPVGVSGCGVDVDVSHDAPGVSFWVQPGSVDRTRFAFVINYRQPE